MKEKRILEMTKKRQNFLQHKNNKTYTDGSKNTEKKVGFAVIFAHIIRKGVLLNEAQKPPLIQSK